MYMSCSRNPSWQVLCKSTRQGGHCRWMALDADGSLKAAFMSLNAPLFPSGGYSNTVVGPTTLASLVFFCHPVRAVLLVLGTVETLCAEYLCHPLAGIFWQMIPPASWRQTGLSNHSLQRLLLSRT